MAQTVECVSLYANKSETSLKDQIVKIAETVPSERPESERMGWLARGFTLGLVSGMIAGLIAGGVGSRIAMRISAIMGGQGIAGLETENGNIVGQITPEGTIFLLIFGMFPGIVGGWLFIALRKSIPGPAVCRGLTFGLLLLLILGSIVIDDGNGDFAKLGTPFVNVCMFSMLFVVFGLLVHPISAFADRKLPQVHQGLSKKWSYLYAATAVLPLIFLAVATAGIGGLGAIVIAASYFWWPKLERRRWGPVAPWVEWNNSSKAAVRNSLFVLAATMGSIQFVINISRIAG